MPEQPMVVVRGEAVREVPPEIAQFTVTVTVHNRNRQATLTRLTERAAEIRTLLDGFSEAIERRETSGVQVHPEFDRDHGISLYAGNVSTTVTVADFAALAELLLKLAAAKDTAVSGPWWQLRPGSRAGAEVRREAITDALTRAREYAEAVGARVDRLVEIADEGTGGGGGGMMRAAAYGMESAAAPELDLDPQQQTVHASVVVRVAITEPQSLG